MSRLNDTAAIAKAPLRNGGTRTVSVEKIDNGYLTRTSEYNDKVGSYKSSTTYSREAPSGDADDSKRGGVGCEGLSDTKKYLGSDV